jgi:hypothetical protein
MERVEFGCEGDLTFISLVVVVVVPEEVMGVGVKLSFGLVCKFTSWLVFLCTKASVRLFVQFCHVSMYVACTMILII